MLGRDGPAAKPAGYTYEARLRVLLAEGLLPDPFVKVHQSPGRVANSQLSISFVSRASAVVLRQDLERGLGLPGHIRVASAEPPFVHLYNAIRCHIQVVARLSTGAVRQRVLDEGEHKRTV